MAKTDLDKFRLAFQIQWISRPCNWMGVRIRKYPTDLFVYQMLIHDLKPDVLIETGTFLGGATLFFAHMMDLVGNGRVISVDYRKFNRPKHPRITYLTCKATDSKMLAQIKSMVKGSCMVVLDSDHHRSFVKRELYYYSPFVTVGQFLVCEDTFLENPIPWKKRNDPADVPREAVKWFLKHNKKFVVEPVEYMLGMNPGGWLKRIRA